MLKKLTIGFSKSKKKFPIGSWLLRWFQGTEYSHTYLNFYSESLNRSLIYEAVGVGVRFVGLKKWEEHALEVKKYDILVEDENYIKILQWCVDHSGYDYGYIQNLGVLVARVFKLKTNPWKSGINCSEALGELLRLEGFSLPKESDLLTPLDIDNTLKDQL